MTSTSTTRARTIIHRLRNSRYRHNSDIMELCQMLATAMGSAMDLGDGLGEPEKPPRSLYHENPAAFMRLYMRWYRHNGQTGKPGNQYKSELREEQV
jgi:hypothetical protein